MIKTRLALFKWRHFEPEIIVCAVRWYLRFSLSYRDVELRLYVLDGGKALHAAVKKYAGESAPIQRCQVHKRRNVLDHLTDEQKPLVAKKLNAAYALEDYAEAKDALNMLHRELMDLNPSAARSLGEGLEETLTVHRLHVPPRLRKTLASTNVIESAFSIVERVCANVK